MPQACAAETMPKAKTATSADSAIFLIIFFPQKGCRQFFSIDPFTIANFG
jgi:hypothetical protein